MDYLPRALNTYLASMSISIFSFEPFSTFFSDVLFQVKGIMLTVKMSLRTSLTVSEIPSRATEHFSVINFCSFFVVLKVNNL